jgi:ABC-type uncharacterized transport system YnjBCD permease subunit
MISTTLAISNADNDFIVTLRSDFLTGYTSSVQLLIVGNIYVNVVTVSMEVKEGFFLLIVHIARA